MLPGSLPDRKILQLGRSSSPDGHSQLIGGVAAPEFTLLRNDVLERHFHPVRIDAAGADLVNEIDRNLGIGCGVELQRRPVLIVRAHQEAIALAADADAVLAQNLRHHLSRTAGLLVIPVHQGINPATGSAHRDALQALGRRLAEARGKIRNDKEVILLRDIARLLVVVSNGLVFIAEIHLDHFLDVLVELTQLLLDLPPLRPDPPVDHTVLVVSQMHDPREVFPQPNRIDNGEVQLARRGGGQQAQDDVVERLKRRFTSKPVSLEKQRAVVGQLQGHGNFDRSRIRKAQVELLCQRIPGHGNPPEARHIVQFGGGLPPLKITLLPRRGEGCQRLRYHSRLLVDRLHPRGPLRLHFVSSRPVGRFYFPHHRVVFRLQAGDTISSSLP